MWIHLTFDMTFNLDPPCW